MDTRKIIVIDDNPAIHDDIRKVLGHREASLDDAPDAAALFLGAEETGDQIGFRVDGATQGREGVEKVLAALELGEPYTLAFVDMRMPPGWDGLETIERLWQVDPDLQIVICSAYSDYSWREIRERLGETDSLLILKKPFDNAEVRQLAVALTEKWRLTNESRERDEARRARLNLVEDSLSKQRSQLELATNLANLGYWAFDSTNQQLLCSPHVYPILGLPPDSMGPELDGLVAQFDESDRENIAAAFESTLDSGAELCCKTSTTLANGETRHLQIHVIREVAADSGSKALFGVMQDVTENERALRAVRHASLHDPLTDLPNRVQLFDQLTDALRLSDQPDEGTALVLLDVDNFKTVNDSLGHPVGDGVLVAVSERLGKLQRRQDMLARLGGDEFAIVLGQISSPRQVADILDRFYEAMQAPFEVDGKRVLVTLSAGVALAPENGLDVDELTRAADLALYRAKRDGRGVYRFFDKAMDTRMQIRRQTEIDLKIAIEEQQFQLDYQPIVCAQSGQVKVMEALVRWLHPIRDRIGPDEFIPIAEDTGSIVPLGRWVLEQACRDASTWPADVRVAVNVSAVQFQQANLLAMVQEVLQATGFDPMRLELEITESLFVKDTRRTFETLSRLRDWGVSIVVDDFGTGYSSLGCLRSFPFNKLKLDKSFLLDASEEQGDLAIIRAVAGLGESLGMTTCAEGVETPEHYACAQAAGYTFLQGYLFGRPKAKRQLAADLFTTQVPALTFEG